MMHSTIRTTALILSLGVSQLVMSQTAFAQDNLLTIDQVGNYSNGTVTQHGDHNNGQIKQISHQTAPTADKSSLGASIYQTGSSNVSKVDQQNKTPQTSVRASVNQDGGNQLSLLSQLGDDLTGTITQKGHDQQGYLNMHGQNAKGTITQTGFNNGAGMDAAGDTPLPDQQSGSISQNGSANNAALTYAGSNIASSIAQTGTGNKSTLQAWGKGADSFVKQDGNGNNADTYALGTGNKAGVTVNHITQAGVSNNVSSFQSGTSGSTNGLQNGINNDLRSHAQGDRNIVNSTQIGQNNKTVIDTYGNDNVITAGQNGLGNSNTQAAYGLNNTSTVKQLGNTSGADTTQFGAKNKATIDQNSNQTKPSHQNIALGASIYQNGTDNVSKVNQVNSVDQNYVRAGTSQTGERNNINLDQQGASFSSILFQHGQDNNIKAATSGNFASHRLVQQGSNNDMDVTINGQGEGYSKEANEGTATGADAHNINFAHMEQNGTGNKFNASLSGSDVHVTGGHLTTGDIVENVNGAVQEGTNNTASAVVTGTSSRIDVLEQRGVGNYASQTVHNDTYASPTVASLRQSGDANRYTLNTTGTNNIINSAQTGLTNNATVDIAGTANYSTLNQSGNGNTSAQLAHGLNNVTNVAQSGNTSDAHTEQYGTNNLGTITQSSNQTKPAHENVSLATTIHQEGTNNVSHVNQVNSVDQNYARVGTFQYGDRNNVSVDQQGASFTTVSYQHGNSNDIKSKSTGNYAAQRLVQQGQLNAIDTTINGGGGAYAHNGPETQDPHNINFIALEQDGNSNSFKGNLSGQNVHIDGTHIIQGDGSNNNHGAWQEGNSNAADITATGQSARIDAFEQRGTGNRATVSINNNNYDNQSVALVAQHGDGNFYHLLSDGNGNVSHLTQTGNENQAEALISGSSNNTTINSNGNSNTAYMNIQGNNNTANINQIGNANEAHQEINGSNNMLAIVQQGYGNYAKEAINGSNNQLSINQQGNNNRGTLDITGNDNNIGLSQIGNNQNYVLTQTGNGMSMQIVQKQM